MTWLTVMNVCVKNDHGYVPFVVSTSQSFPHSWLITGFVTRLTLRVPLLEQELFTLPEHINSPPVFSVVRVIRSLVLFCFVDRCLSFCTFSFGQCVVCSSSIYGFWFHHWYIDEQTTKLYNYTAYLSTGNDNIHTLTSQGNYKLRIDIEDFSGDSRYAVYDVFIVGDEASQYLLDIGRYSGNVGKMFN